jgi:hypothetical protein
MSEFKDRLWQELMREHGADLARMTGRTSKHRRRRPRVLAGTSLGVAGAGAALALVLTAAGSTPAFAVNKNRDGTVSVTITRLGGISGANAKLARIGVRAVAVPVVAGCQAVPPITAALPPSPSALRKNLIARAVATARIDPKQIPAGKTLVLAAAPGASGRVRVARLHAVTGPAPRCFWSRVPAPGPGTVVCGPARFLPGGGPPGGSSTTTTDTTTAPPTQTLPTQTATTDTSTTGTNTTDTTSTGPVQTPVPPGQRWIGCAPPPQCAVTSNARVRPGRATANPGRAKLQARRAQIVRPRKAGSR